MLHSLVCSDSPPPYCAIPYPRFVLPFLGLYTLVALNPQRLENVEFHIYRDAEVSELLDGCWTIVPPNSTPSSSITARIHDATALLPTDHDPGCDLQLSTMPENEQRYWRLPIEVTLILTYLLYSVAHLGKSDIEELRLAIELRSLLSLHSVKYQGPSSGPVDGGGNPDVGRKRGRDEDPDDPKTPKQTRRNPRLGKGRAPGSVRAGESPPIS